MSEIVNIPDENFRNCILEILNKPDDYKITKEDCEKITKIRFYYKNIKSLDGIQYFVNLNYLYCKRNRLINLDLSKIFELKYLNCSNNQLTSLDLSKNTYLNSLSCYYNQLTNLDVSKNTLLNTLNCNDNQIFDLKLNKIINTTTYYKAIITNFNNLTIQI